MAKKKLPAGQYDELIKTLRTRFEKNMGRHKGMDWTKVQARLENAGDEKLWSLNEMEASGGEPDVIRFDKKSGEYTFCDCSPESPAGRRSLCYDQAALKARKENKPKDSVLAVAEAMGVELLNEDEYRELQQLGKFDAKTSSWIKTPGDIRKLGGAVFCDFRYGTVFLYHNGADSYYAARGFRSSLKI